MSRFTLPTFPNLLRQDRFDVVGSDDLEVPFWEILTAILRPANPIEDVASLIETLQTIRACLEDGAKDYNAANSDYEIIDTDYEYLRQFLSQYLSNSPNNIFFKEIWPRLVQIALEMPSLFPSHSLDCTRLTSRQCVFVFSRRQLACLVVHQFLCSLPSHPWRTQSFVDLRIWYSSSAASSHAPAMHAYLTALFTYFERVASSTEESGILSFGLEDWPIIFTLKTLRQFDIEAAESVWNERALCPVDFVPLAEPKTSPEYLGLNNGACVIAANKSVGLGPSATQEEVQVGSTPESYPVGLLVRPLHDNQVLVVQGAEAMVSVRGYGAEAWLEEILEPDYTGPVTKPGTEDVATAVSKWQHRTMLFMDAIQFDFNPAGSGTQGILRDLEPGNLSRELWKAYNAFSSALVRRSERATITIDMHHHGSYAVVATGLWGCGAFGGNKHIKSVIQWCAASMAQVERLQFITSTSEQHTFAEAFRGFIDQLTRIVDRPPHVADVFGVLVQLEREMRAQGNVAVSTDEIFDYVLQKLSETSEQ